jgi:hypothetical protein
MGTEPKKETSYYLDEEFAEDAPLLCIDCNFIRGIFEGEKHKWICLKGFEVVPENRPPCNYS